MSSRNKWRIILDVVVLLAPFFLPWWLGGLLVLIGIAYFRFYFEGLVAAIVTDMFYGRADMSFFKSASFIILVIIVLSEFVIKPRVRNV